MMKAAFILNRSSEYTLLFNTYEEDICWVIFFLNYGVVTSWITKLCSLCVWAEK